jgi:hypothetical protein
MTSGSPASLSAPAVPVSLARRLASMAAGCIALAAAGILLARYPGGWPWLTLLLALYAGVLAYRPEAWLIAVPALLPVLDLAPWTGWIAIDELDALLLVTAGIGYLRTAGRPAQLRLPAGHAVLLAALAALMVAGLAKWPMPGWPLDGNALFAYTHPANGLRTVKGFAWAIVLLPLMQRCAGPQGTLLAPRFLGGMALGLAGVCVAALWERAAFAGILDFGSGYRITALFSAMHVGGSTLDGYLALALPAVGYWLLRGGRATAPALALLLAATYTVFTTFSRAGYFVFLLSALLFGLVWLRSRANSQAGSAQPPRPMRWVILGMAGILFIRLGMTMFQMGGYRAMAVCAVCALAVFWLAGQRVWPVKAALPAALPAAALLGAASWFATMLIPRSAYLSFAAATAMTAAGAWLLRRPASSRVVSAATLAAWIWLGVCAILAAQYGRGNEAAVAAAWFLCALYGLGWANLAAGQALWRSTRESGIAAAVAIALAAMVIPIVGNYAAKSRSETSGRDLQTRLQHYAQIASLSANDPLAVLTGIGPGRFPSEYQWRHPRAAGLPTQLFTAENGNAFVRLIGARDAVGVGEPTRFGQRLANLQPGVYRLQLRARSPMQRSELEVTLCEKLILDRTNCTVAYRLVAPTGQQWQDIEVQLGRKHPARSTWGIGVPVQFGLSNVGLGSTLDIDDVRLIDPFGNDLLRNPGFDAGNDYWFFSASTYFWPWHMENILLNVYFELGVAGLAAFVLLVVATLLRAWRAPAEHRPAASALAIAIVALMSLGVLHSTLDVPRIALLFYLMLLALALLAAGKLTRVRRRRRRSSAA